MKNESKNTPTTKSQVVGKSSNEIQDEEPIQSFVEAISSKKKSTSHIGGPSQHLKGTVIGTLSTPKSTQTIEQEKVQKTKGKREVGVITQHSQTKKTKKSPSILGDSINIIDVEE